MDQVIDIINGLIDQVILLIIFLKKTAHQDRALDLGEGINLRLEGFLKVLLKKPSRSIIFEGF